VKKLGKGCGVFVLLLIVAVIAIAAIASMGDDDDPETETASRCRNVPAAMGDGIATGIEEGITASGWQAVKSSDYENLFMIAGRLSGPGMDDDTIGVWASNSLEAGGGLILAVNGLAQEFSDWPDGDGTDAETSVTDDGVSEAIECVQ